MQPASVYEGIHLIGRRVVILFPREQGMSLTDSGGLWRGASGRRERTATAHTAVRGSGHVGRQRRRLRWPPAHPARRGSPQRQQDRV